MLWADDLVLFPDAHKGFVTEIRRFERAQGAFQNTNKLVNLGALKFSPRIIK